MFDFGAEEILKPLQGHLLLHFRAVSTTPTLFRLTLKVNYIWWTGWMVRKWWMLMIKFHTAPWRKYSSCECQYKSYFWHHVRFVWIKEWCLFSSHIFRPEVSAFQINSPWIGTKCDYFRNVPKIPSFFRFLHHHWRMSKSTDNEYIVKLYCKIISL